MGFTGRANLLAGAQKSIVHLLAPGAALCKTGFPPFALSVASWDALLRRSTSLLARCNLGGTCYAVLGETLLAVSGFVLANVLDATHLRVLDTSSRICTVHRSRFDARFDVRALVLVARAVAVVETLLGSCFEANALFHVLARVVQTLLLVGALLVACAPHAVLLFEVLLLLFPLLQPLESLLSLLVFCRRFAGLGNMRHRQ